METLSNNVLIEVYEKALKYDLEDDFIELILGELKKRGIKDERIVCKS